MKAILISLLMGMLCLGITGCGGGDDDSPATVTTVTTNATTGAVQTNVVAVEDAPAADVAAEPAGDEAVGLGAPVAGQTVTGKWLGSYENGGNLALLSLMLTQNGDAVTGTYVFSDAGSGTILSGVLAGQELLLGVKRNGILCELTGHVDLDAMTYIGTWADKAGNSGTFSLR